ALYTCMLNEQGGVIDDLIITFVDLSWYRIVVNAGTKDKDLAWFRKHARSFDVQIELRDDLSMIAVQGPEAIAKVHAASPEIAEIARGLSRFESGGEADLFIARTGYTGEDGYEIMMPDDDIEGLWLALIEQDVAPIGLGARDTLRLEAGMNLYGQDMDETTSPLVSGLAWTVSMENGRAFIGREILEKEKAAGVEERFVGLVLQDKGVLRAHQKVIIEGVGIGETTSGSFSPTMRESIALARIPVGDADSCLVEMRGKQLKAKIVKPPFVRNGKVVVS
ncbi:MAG: glycine cleavage system aminomethyltransferase GcvT, partial [Gammaproteobacteria bacterium]|nr:glycine cleavage system aminomethyltransferase GcvT [Gammaproteobacteria bacterium]